MNKKILIISGLVLILIISLFFVFQGKDSLQNDSGENSIPKIKETNKELSELVLDLSDLPEGYEIIVMGPRISSDVSAEGLELGWKEGYQITFAKEGGSIFDTTTIYQGLSKYPTENISLVLATYDETTMEELPNPNIGDMTTAFKNVESGNYLIEFVKKDVYVYFSTRGNYELLKELAIMVEKEI